MDTQKRLCLEQSYVETMLGRRRYLPGGHSSIPRIREEAFRQAINHPVQGSATEIVKMAERILWQDILPFFRSAGIVVEPILQVHDELILEVQKDAAEEVVQAVKYAMESATVLSVPIAAEYHITRTADDGGSWADLK